MDFVFSFDSLVHAEREVLAAYVPEILRVLKPGGVAFIHHSNWAAVRAGVANDHGRGMDVGASDVAAMVADAGGALLIQERINWGHGVADGVLSDCLTLFGWTGPEPRHIENLEFMREGKIIRLYQSPYGRISR